MITRLTLSVRNAATEVKNHVTTVEWPSVVFAASRTVQEHDPPAIPLPTFAAAG